MKNKVNFPLDMDFIYKNMQKDTFSPVLDFIFRKIEKDVNSFFSYIFSRFRHFIEKYAQKFHVLQIYTYLFRNMCMCKLIKLIKFPQASDFFI